MFAPNKDEVRRFLCRAYQLPATQLSPIETIARTWIEKHPEYHQYLHDAEVACTLDFPPENGITNPFLHLSMHLSLSEQISIDQPKEIRAIALALQQQYDEHETQHLMMDALAEMIWQAQRQGVSLNEQDYLTHLRTLITTPLAFT